MSFFLIMESTHVARLNVVLRASLVSVLLACCNASLCRAQEPDVPSEEILFGSIGEETEEGPSEAMQSETEEQVSEETPRGQEVVPEEALAPKKETQAGAVEKQSAEVEELAPDPLPAIEPRERRDGVLEKQFKKALMIDVEGPIFGRFYWYLNNRLDMAKETGCDLVIIKLNSPGGLLVESIDLLKRLSKTDWATTIVWIPEKAISGAAIISLGAERIYMQEGSRIGDAGVISFNEMGVFKYTEEKFVSDTVVEIKPFAVSRGRPAAFAEAMMVRKLDVLEAIDLETNEVVFLKRVELELPKNEGRYKVIGPVLETLEDRYLTVSGKRAMELQIADGVFADEDAMLAALNIETISRTQLNWQDKTVYFLNSPWITGLLLIVGLIALYIELVAPGISVAGLISLLCFGIFFWSHALGGTSGWLEVMMFVLGVICVICEIFVLPGFGVFGITGIVLLVLSLLMATQGFVIPETTTQWGQLQTNALIVLGSMLGVVVLIFVQIFILDSVPGLNRFQLTAPEEPIEVERDVPATLLQTGTSGPASVVIGSTGVAESDLRPSGKILLEDQLVDVITEGDYVDSGAEVEVIKIEGNRIIVRAQR